MSGQECGCCPQCREELPDSWVSDLWRYCPHTRIMSKRRSRGEPWVLERNVSPPRAVAHLAAAVERMKTWAKSRGIDWESANRVLTWYRERDPDRK